VGFDKYTDIVSERMGTLGITLSSLHTSGNKKKTLEEAEIIITGGGNTFHLLHILQQEKLLETVRERVMKGIPYIGWSAGSNLACPTIKTTNDMPVVETDGFKALDLIPFQINPHYTDFRQEDHAGETREMRIEEFLLVNRKLVVVGLREHSLLQIEEKKIDLKGKRSCRIFRYGNAPVEIRPGEDLSFLLQ
jgi:dipeptidase E